MYVKEFSLPEEIPRLEALLRRLPEEHPQRTLIEKDLAKQLRGWQGEKAVTYYLDFLPEKEFFIFHNLRLPTGKYFFQMDFLILSACYALILECKNFYGTLFFDEPFKQLIRVVDDQEEGFEDPISQAKWNKKQLQEWLEVHRFPAVPIDFLIVIGDPATIIKAAPHSPETKRHVVHARVLLERMNELMKGCRKEVLDKKTLRKLCKLLLRSHTPKHTNVLKKYSLSEEDLLKGVRCSGCGKLPMKRVHGGWECPYCHKKDKNAHLDALRDYFLLVDSSITNKKFREFVGCGSMDTAKRLLAELKFPFSGNNKGRIYLKPENLDILISFKKKN